jgi:hypothetical protein
VLGVPVGLPRLLHFPLNSPCLNHPLLHTPAFFIIFYSIEIDGRGHCRELPTAKFPVLSAWRAKIQTTLPPLRFLV